MSGVVSATRSQTVQPRTFDRYSAFSDEWSLSIASRSPDPLNVTRTMSPSRTVPRSSAMTPSMVFPVMSTSRSRHTIPCVGTKRSSDTRPSSTVTR